MQKIVASFDRRTERQQGVLHDFNNATGNALN